jgi:antitoxin ParD1/3/4
MNFSLPPHLEALVRRKVERGQYESFRQVIEEALQLLEERDQVRALRRERLLQEIAKGIYQADNRQLVDRGEVYRALRRKPSSANE